MSAVIPVKLAYNLYEPVISAEDATLAPLIFLHGLAGSKEHWDGISTLIANETKRKAFAVDARNHGDSDWSEDFNFDQNVDDLFHFMDTHNISKGVIIGHSMGGITGIRAALRQPERVEKLVVEDIYVRNVPQESLDGIATAVAQAQESLEKLPNNLDENEAKKIVLEQALENVPEELKDSIRRAVQNAPSVILKRKPDGRYALKTNVPVILKELKDANTVMSEPRGSYNRPACFIYGDASQFNVKDEETHIRQFFPKAEFVCIKGANHGPHFEFPAEFTDAAVKYILGK